MEPGTTETILAGGRPFIPEYGGLCDLNSPTTNTCVLRKTCKIMPISTNALSCNAPDLRTQVKQYDSKQPTLS